MPATGRPYRIRPPGRVRVRSVDVQRIAVLEEARVPAANFGADELDSDFLADVGARLVVNSTYLVPLFAAVATGTVWTTVPEEFRTSRTSLFAVLVVFELTSTQ